MNILSGQHYKKCGIVFFVILCIAAAGCKSSNSNNTQGTFLPEFIDGQLVVWRKTGVSSATMDIKAQNLRDRYSGTLVRKVCENCDDSLELWTGTAITNFINSEVASPSTRPRGNPSGDDDTLRYSLNIVVRLPDEGQFALAQQPVAPITTNTAQVTVAVFDTGVDGDVTNNFTSSVTTCKPAGDKGWDFINNNNNTADVYPTKHGTVVSKFIIDEVRANAAGNRVNILPVKIFGSDGSSDLFSVLCGFAYAQKAGAKIINASFGFYDYGAEPNPILLEYVRKVLTNNNILLVAAAGNAISAEDAYATSTVGLPMSGLRDLEVHHFYPGRLAKNLPNVYCVTTALLSTVGVSPTQNYSKNVVDIGAIADFPDYSFQHPFNPLLTMKGSSFATPIFTGKLVSWYDGYSATLDNKATILNFLKTNGVVFEDVPVLAEKIRGGRYVR